MSTDAPSYEHKSADLYAINFTNEFKEAKSKQIDSLREAELKGQSFFLKFQTKWTIAIALIIGITFLVQNISNGNSKTTKYCYDELCNRTGDYLLATMNFSADPCDDFYAFACGNWKNQHPISNYELSTDVTNEMEEQTIKRILDYLSQPDSPDEPESVHQARKLYRSCLAAEKLNEYVGFEQLSRVLEEVGLPIAPSFRNSSANFSWVDVSVMGKKMIGMNYFIEFYVSLNPKNHSVKMFGFSGTPSENYLHSQKILKFKKDRKVRDGLTFLTSLNFSQYEMEKIKETFNYKYLIKIVKYMYRMKWSEDIENAFDELYMLYLSLVEQIEELSNLNFSHTPAYITLDAFQNITDEISECQNTSSIIDWKNFIKLIFKDVENVELDFEGRDKIIMIRNEEYLKSMIKIIASTPPHVLEFYMWWKTLRRIIPYTKSILNNFTKKNFINIIYVMLGIKERPRNTFCAERVQTLFGPAASYFIINDDTIKQNTRKISEMVDNIKTAFVEEIENLTWMDEKTREKSLIKLKAMKKQIGYPAWMEDRKIFDEFYRNAKMSENDYCKNIIQENKRRYALFLKKYLVVENPEDEWFDNPLEVNAFNSIERNVITIPAGIFHFPFYQHGLEALNYGAIGSCIGHELTHGFDNTGKNYDEVGRLKEWWSSETKRKFERKNKCFIDQYNYFNIAETTETDNKKKSNGDRTLDENIADNGGLRNAYYAYQNYVERNGKEKQIPALSQYNHNQLFFLAFANSWCEHSASDLLKIASADEHSSNFIRVQVTLMNSKEFANTWHCPVDSPMNPKDKCQIW